MTRRLSTLQYWKLSPDARSWKPSLQRLPLNSAAQDITQERGSKLGSILVVGNGVALWKEIQSRLSESGFRVKAVRDGKSGLKVLEEEEFDVVLMNAEFPHTKAGDILRAAKSICPFSEVIVLAQDGGMKAAFDFMRMGAYDYITRPLEIDKIVSIAQRALEEALRTKTRRWVGGKTADSSITSKMIGKSSAVKSVVGIINKVAQTDSSVLLLGETGTGKSLIAHALHQGSRRSSSPPTVVNCCTIPETMMESELFGFEKGAFTDAKQCKPGLLEVANGSTLFLDEVGDLSPKLQSKLLQVVETGTFRRLGSNREMKVDIRVISATNKDLRSSSSDFREDLYYRLGVITIDVPSLRNRTEDIPSLTTHFMDALKSTTMPHKEISSAAMNIMQGYSWPGNIRELRNVIERLMILVDRDTIEVSDLPPAIQKQSLEARTDILPRKGRLPTLKEVERTYIERVMKQYDGQRTKAAEILGITRATLYNKLKKYGVSSEED